MFRTRIRPQRRFQTRPITGLWVLILAIVAIAGLAGCHNPCEDDSDCFAGLSCIGSSVCPDDVVCVWEGEPGICGLPSERACRMSGGTWDENSCGDYTCGEFPACDAIIPGCDCGPHENFVEGVGCQPDPSCKGECRWDSDCPRGFECEGSSVCSPDVVCVWEGEPGVCVPSDRFLCRETGGDWDELACGDYVCGDPNACEAIIPGCDCGPRRNFVEGEGCVTDHKCADGCRWNKDCDAGEVCSIGVRECSGLVGCPTHEQERAGTCVEGCWHDLHCPRGQVCEGAVICPPGALCLRANEPGTCVDPKGDEVDLCERTGGEWDSMACGHRRCESDIQCLAIIPGCDCGPKANFDPERGCVDAPECADR